MAVTLRIAVPFERRAYHSFSQDSPTFQKLVALRIHELRNEQTELQSAVSGVFDLPSVPTGSLVPKPFICFFAKFRTASDEHATTWERD